ncbi:MAG: DUF305 domain-containing protein [Patescibacteria group bacterium]
MESKKLVLFGISGLVAGIVLTALVAGYSVNNDKQGMMKMMGMDTSKVSSVSSHDEMSMSQMTEQLKSKTGDEFDKAFVEMMISHHEGAVDMAELIPSRAKHDELKKMGDDIISAQTKEIADMKQWQQDWGYSADEMMEQMHGGQ